MAAMHAVANRTMEYSLHQGRELRAKKGNEWPWVKRPGLWQAAWSLGSFSEITVPRVKYPAGPGQIQGPCRSFLYYQQCCHMVWLGCLRHSRKQEYMPEPESTPYVTGIPK